MKHLGLRARSCLHDTQEHNHTGIALIAKSDSGLSDSEMELLQSDDQGSKSTQSRSSNAEMPAAIWPAKLYECHPDLRALRTPRSSRRSTFLIGKS